MKPLTALLVIVIAMLVIVASSWAEMRDITVTYDYVPTQDEIDKGVVVEKVRLYKNVFANPVCEAPYTEEHTFNCSISCDKDDIVLVDGNRHYRATFTATLVSNYGDESLKSEPYTATSLTPVQIPLPSAPISTNILMQ